MLATWELLHDVNYRGCEQLQPFFSIFAAGRLTGPIEQGRDKFSSSIINY